jgi:alkylated DNA repair dioxygenase AlkB
MSLFDNLTVINNLGSFVTYQGDFLDHLESDRLYKYFLENMLWTTDKYMTEGKIMRTKRKIAWFADNNFNYNYSGSSRLPKEWDKELLLVKCNLEKTTKTTYNSCLLNLYHNGDEGMAFHSDDQNHLARGTAVAIVSLGAERFFKLRETKNHQKQHKILLEKGSLLVMTGQTQQYYQHEIPKMAVIKTPRISLTWRTMK